MVQIMIKKILIGNILESKTQTLINTVNCVGIMGKGIALEFKTRFPEMFKDYQMRCEEKEVRLGKPYIYKGLFPPWIINFPTKQDWRSVSKIRDIEEGLKYLVDHYEDWEVESLAVPPLGCGNGQLDWQDVGPLIYKMLETIKIPVEMYAPYGILPKMLTREFLSKSAATTKVLEKEKSFPSLNPAWLALVEILYELEKHPYHHPVGRTIFQKIAYVATQQNLPTHFHFKQESYGPFSPDIIKAISVLANNGLIIEEQKGNMFRIKVGPNYELIREKQKSEIEKYRKIINKTADLFARMDTHQAEIATTIFYSTKEIKKQNQNVSECDVLNFVMEWKKRRRPAFDEKEVASAIRNLAMLKWLDVKFSDNLPVVEDSL